MVMLKMVSSIFFIIALLVSSVPFFSGTIPTLADGGEYGSLTCEISEPSGGSYMLPQSAEGIALGPHLRQYTNRLPAPEARIPVTLS